MNVFYVYMLIDPRTNIPFYVGKGKQNRAKSHYSMVKHGGSSGNLHKDRIIKKLISMNLKPLIEMVQEGLDEVTAYLLETDTIKIYGIERDGGLLTNCDHGGRTGATNYGPNNGMFGKTHSMEAKAKISKAVTGLKLGKTYEEIYGESEAKRLKRDRSIKLSKPKSSDHKLKCKENSAKGGQKRACQTLGRTMEDLYGKEKTAEIKRKLSEFNSILRVKYRLVRGESVVILVGRPLVLEFLKTNISTFSRRLRDRKALNGWVIVKL